MPQSIKSKEKYIYKKDNSQRVGILQVDFPSGSEGKESACNAGDQGSISGSGRSPGEGNSNPLQYSFLEIPWAEEPDRLQSMRLQSQI